MSSHAVWGPRRHPSASLAARRVARGLWEANQMGGCGCCMGVMAMRAPWMCQYWPSKLTSSPVHKSFMTSRDSLKRLRRSERLVLKASSSSSR